MDGANDQRKRCGHDGQHQVINRQVVGQAEQSKQLAARHTLQSILTTCELRLQGDEENHLCECQRDHGEVDALAPDGQHTKHPAQPGTGQSAHQQAQFRREAPHLHHMPGHVGRAAEESRVAKRQQPGVTQQQVECRSEQCKTQQLHHEDRVRAEEWRNDQRRE